MYVHLTNRDTVECFLTFLKLSTLQSLTMQARTLGQVSTPLDIDVLMVRGREINPWKKIRDPVGIRTQDLLNTI